MEKGSTKEKNVPLQKRLELRAGFTHSCFKKCLAAESGWPGKSTLKVEVWGQKKVKKCPFWILIFVFKNLGKILIFEVEKY